MLELRKNIAPHWQPSDGSPPLPQMNRAAPADISPGAVALAAPGFTDTSRETSGLQALLARDFPYHPCYNEERTIRAITLGHIAVLPRKSHVLMFER